jgi:hypothetical protein
MIRGSSLGIVLSFFALRHVELSSQSGDQPVEGEGNTENAVLGTVKKDWVSATTKLGRIGRVLLNSASVSVVCTFYFHPITFSR